MDFSLYTDCFELQYETVDQAGAKLQTFANLHKAKTSSKEKSQCAVTFVVNGDTAETVAHRNLLK